MYFPYLRGRQYELIALRDNSYILYMNLLQKDEDPSDFIDVYADNMGTICTDKDAIPVYQNYFEQYDVKYNFVPDESGFRRRIRKNRVLLIAQNAVTKMCTCMIQIDMTI